MIRRRHQADEDDTNRWLVSYADFITLLFAFFVVMYAVSSVNQKKYRQLSSAINTAFTKEKSVVQPNTSPSAASAPPAKPANAVPSQPKPLSQGQIDQLQAERSAMQQLGNHFADKLSPLIVDGKIKVTQNNRGLRIDIHDSLLFSPGSADLNMGASAILNDIAKLLQSNDHAIQIEGHTDDTPIHNTAFFSNWELSAVRATSVVRTLASLGIAETRLSALGFGSTQPISSNFTAEGRAKNRHVSMIVLYDSLDVGNDIGTEILPKGSP